MRPSSAYKHHRMYSQFVKLFPVPCIRMPPAPDDLYLSCFAYLGHSRLVSVPDVSDLLLFDAILFFDPPTEEGPLIRSTLRHANTKAPTDPTTGVYHVIVKVSAYLILHFCLQKFFEQVHSASSTHDREMSLPINILPFVKALGHVPSNTSLSGEIVQVGSELL